MTHARKPYPEHVQTIGALLRVPYRYLQQEVYETLARTGHEAVRPAHSAVFRHIPPEGSRVTSLAESAGMTKQSMAALIAHLEQHDYLRVGSDPYDGRAKRVILTERGKAVQREAARLSAEIEARWTVLLGKNDMESLRQLLEKLGIALERR